MIHLHENRYEYFEEINEGILRQIPVTQTGNRPFVLDVGCGSGVLSEAIQKKGYEVWGIESCKPIAEKAAGRIARVITADLNNAKYVSETIGDQKFDYLVFSDVLEHVYDPFLVLREYLQYLNKGGLVVISLPNIAAWTNRIKLLLGIFEYADTGIMDRTHIRFFTFASAKEIVKASGYTIMKTDFTPYLTRAALPIIKKVLSKSVENDGTDRRSFIDSPLYAFYMKFVYPVEYAIGFFCKSLFAFRIIIVGRKK